MEALRPLMEQALESVRSGEIPIVIAPTSYGKTRASPVIHRTIVEEGMAYGVIHVAPLRALVREVFTELFAPLGGGVQAYGLTGSEYKSPYLLRVPVAVTIDSFLLNLYRLPVLEVAKVERGVSRGHYYPALAAIKSSLNILDEAHLILDDTLGSGDGYIALAAAIKALACSGARLAIETATLRPETIAEIIQLISECSRVRVISLACNSGRDEYIETLKAKITGLSNTGVKVSVEAIQDHRFTSEYSIRWKTRIASSWDRVLDEVKEQSSSEVILVAVNTVDRAIELYEKLRDHNAVLIHGRLTDADREEAVKAINSVTGRGYGIIVATQVIEAGVDVNASKVYTEAAPLESLIQRAGRACRRGRILEECKTRGAEVVIVASNDALSKSPYDYNRIYSDLKLIMEALSKGIDWRLPCSPSAISYTRLLSVSPDAEGAGRLGRLIEPLAGLYEAYLTSDATPDFILSILDRVGACSIYRSLSPIQLYVEDSGLISLSLEIVARQNSWFWRVVEKIEGAPVIVALDEDGRITAEAPLRELVSLIRHGRVECRNILKELLRAPLRLGLGKGRYTLAFRVKRDSYVKGVGLKTTE